MVSRYDIMIDSITGIDPIDQQVYPDPLVIDYAKFQYNEPPYIVDIDERLQTYPYIITNSLYQVAAYDDIIFSINNIPHRSLLMKTKVYDDWSSLITYSKNDVINYQNNIYISLKDDNLNNTPGQVSIHWSNSEASSLYPTIKFPVVGDLNKFMKRSQ
jgi:hypothetical protein